MPKLNSFAAIRAPSALAALVSTRTYKSYSKKELIQKLATNEFSFLHIIKSESKKKKEKFALIKSNLQRFLKKGNFIKDVNNNLYIYEQKTRDSQFTGVIGLASLDDYLEGKILKHEKTIEKREALFANYLKNIGFHAEPVLLAREKNAAWDHAMDETMKLRPEADFATADGVLHKLWIPSKENTRIIIKASESIDKFYVADGHHRLSSSALVGESNGILAMVIKSEQLKITPFYLLVKGPCVNNLDWTLDLDAKLLDRSPNKLPEKGIYAFNDRGWWHITKDDLSFPESKWLCKNLLSPFWNIIDERNDPRIRYISGNRNPKEIEQERKKDEVIFISPSPSWNQIQEASDNGIMLPPKSTYIEPKLRSGMTLFSWK
jgi:uncharacterized protein (DUF1015 family)|tara:strand:- start:2605 stop:3735 length:1131 start_codon:yes stop_codon:yes gene_type:complete